MILIADSGATKTDWRVIQQGRVIDKIQTIGFNPYFVNSELIKETLEKELYPFFDNKAIGYIFFYGAGCSTENKGNIVSNALEDFFYNARVYVYHDLLGAARALCGTAPGVACILGTGSNSCFYDGKIVAENVTSLGYLFGDDGSGAQIGKALLSAYLRMEMPSDIAPVFENKYQLSVEGILDAVYKKPFPNRYLASFAVFASEHIAHPYISSIVKDCFRNFFVEQVTHYKQCKDYPVHFTGSISYYFSNLLKEVAEEFQLQTGTIQPTPIDGLIRFHLENPNLY